MQKYGKTWKWFKNNCYPKPRWFKRKNCLSKDKSNPIIDFEKWVAHNIDSRHDGPTTALSMIKIEHRELLEERFVKYIILTINRW